MHRRLDAHKGEIIGHILAILVLTTCDQVLEKAVACKAFCRCSIPAFIQVV